MLDAVIHSDDCFATATIALLGSERQTLTASDSA